MTKIIKAKDLVRELKKKGYVLVAVGVPGRHEHYDCKRLFPALFEENKWWCDCKMGWKAIPVFEYMGNPKWDKAPKREGIVN